jgi:hypothetical protein
VILQTTTTAYEPIALALAAVLAAAVIVERVVEGAKNVLDLTRLRSPKRHLKPPEDAAEPVDKLVGVLQEADRRDAAEAALEKRPDPAADDPPDPAVFEWEERLPPSTIVIQDAVPPPKAPAVRGLVIQLLATATGIVVAHYSGLTLFRTLGEALFGSAVVGPTGDYLLTGLVIGGGSAPAHLLVRFISERRSEVEAKPEAPPAAPVVAAAAVAVPALTDEGPVATAVRVSAEVAVSPERWVDIPYTGGIDRDLLAGIHRRPDDPNLIVYHHTAMHRASTMDDLVRVIKDRRDQNGNRWTTGYHCAILADGSVHPFCRWDRYGCHAAGFNRQSLGITFMGNFETDPSVPFSNPDGRYGPPHPTEAQLHAGARMVALWTFLYGLDPDFAQVIIPHKQIAPKPCPGGNFPYADFEKLVRYFRRVWAESPETRERIRAFATQPFLYVDPRRSKVKVHA